MAGWGIEKRRELFAAQLGLRVSTRRRELRDEWLQSLRAVYAGQKNKQSWQDHDFTLCDKRGVLGAEVWEPYADEAKDYPELVELAETVGLSVAVLPPAFSNWRPGDTMPIVFYQPGSPYQEGIETGLKAIIKQEPGGTLFLHQSKAQISEVMTFREYVLSRKATANPRGDFIKDFRDDSRYLLEGYKFKSKMKLMAYLYDHGACEGAIEAASKMWDEYEHYRKAQKQRLTKAKTELGAHK